MPDLADLSDLAKLYNYGKTRMLSDVAFLCFSSSYIFLYISGHASSYIPPNLSVTTTNLTLEKKERSNCQFVLLVM